MTKPTIVAKIGVTLISVALAAASAAAAAPGTAIMTAGGEERRVSMTAGISHESVGGVNLYRGAPRAPQPQKTEPTQQEIATNAMTSAAPCQFVFRRFRTMRTQGFYSGDRHPSRQFVQGFYSGRWRTRSGPH